jgi:hypothetical protein
MDQQYAEQREYPVRCADDQVHVLIADVAAVHDPSRYRTRCGRTVLRVYDERLETTCAMCSRGHRRTHPPVTYEPCG